MGNCCRSPPVSSDADPDPWPPLKSPLDPRALPITFPFTNKIEGVTTDLDPVRKHLEESSGQFRQGLTCFIIMALHTYLTRQVCASWPGQRFLIQFGSKQIVDPASLHKLAGSNMCATPELDTKQVSPCRN